MSKTTEIAASMEAMFPGSKVCHSDIHCDVVITESDEPGAPQEAIVIDVSSPGGAEIVCGTHSDALNDIIVIMRDVPVTTANIERRISVARRALAAIEIELRRAAE